METVAVEFSRPREIRLVEAETGPVDEGDVLVRTLYSGISSGTELLAYRGEIDPATPLDETLGSLSGRFEFPFRFGYSCVGVVIETRSSITEGSHVFAFHPHQGAFVISATDAVAIEGFDPRLATMFPLVETGLQISLDTGAVAHQFVVVMGLGVVGLLCALLLQRAGATVIGVEPRQDRRNAAADLGVRAVPPEEVDYVVEDLTRGLGAGLAIEVSGNAAALAQSLGLLAHEGTAIVGSWYGSKDVSLPLGSDFHRRRLSIRSSQVSTIPSQLSAEWTLERRRATARSLLDELPLKRLATHEFSIEDASGAFDAVDRGEEGLLHAALRYT